MDTFRQMLEANVVSFMMTAKYFGRHFKENGYGKIVNLSSVRGKIATKGTGNAGYCTTKGAVDMLTKQLASEYGPFRCDCQRSRPQHHGHPDDWSPCSRSARRTPASLSSST